jgi:lipopolysaccharide transport system permease protein
MDLTNDSENRSHIHIEPPSGWPSIGWQELYAYRELLYFLVWRDIKVRYKQTVLGAAWAILQPFFMMVVFTFFFGRLANIETGGIPYPLLSYTALVPWYFFSNGLTQSSNSLVGSTNLITKIYFPRVIIPTSAVLSGVLDFAIAFLVLIGMMLFYGHIPTLNSLWLPLFLILAFIAALGVGLWLSAMNVLFRDVRYVVPFLAQAWLFATPIAYLSNMLPEPWRTLNGINPMAGVVEGFRWALLGTDPAPGPILAVSVIVTILIFISGLLYFRRTENYFADVI